MKSSALPVVLFIHGDSFDWGSGNLYDGSVLASYSDVVVVTINYRLGVLGKLITISNIFHKNYTRRGSSCGHPQTKKPLGKPI